MNLLITGSNSYIGTSIDKYLKEHSDISVDTISVRGNEWKSASWSKYDSIFHVAGIAHADVEHTSPEEQKKYYEINCDLAYDCARKAKEEGVSQFIYMSSMLVYPNAAKLGVENMITKDTPINPDNFYGDSKVQAEIKLSTLIDDSFKVVILRPPMIYGPGSKGNYQMLRKFALKLPIFPNIKNQRSMLYVENLAEFVRLMIVNRESGIFFPQNKDYSNTSLMTKEIAKVHGKNLHLIGLFNPFLKLLGRTNGKLGKLACKAFGNLTYDLTMSEYKEEYRISSFENSIINSEG